MSFWTTQVAAALASGLVVAAAVAQAPAPEETAIEMISQLDSIGDSDQARIAEWVTLQIDRLSQAPEQEQREAAKKFRETFRRRFENPRNTPMFKAQLAAQTAAVAAQMVGKASSMVAYGIARVLVDMNRPETLAGHIAGLQSEAPIARYLSARGIYELQPAIASDKEKAERAISSLREAALVEKDAVALAQMYRAMGFPAPQTAAVVQAYSEVFAKRSGATGGVNGAELEALNYLRNPAVLSALNPAQKTQLPAALAAFMRRYVERYNQPKLSFEEIDRLERLMSATEEIIEGLGASGGGSVRKVLEEGGYERRADVAAEAFKWIGDPNTKTAGVLNSAPWNVPVGG